MFQHLQRVCFDLTGPVPDDVEIQTMLGEAINRLIKHHHKSLKERVSLTNIIILFSRFNWFNWESGMIYFGFGYSFLRFPDPEKVLDPTGSGSDP